MTSRSPLPPPSALPGGRSPDISTAPPPPPASDARPEPMPSLSVPRPPNSGQPSKSSRLRALVWLARCLDAAHALGADRCRVRGVRREDHLVAWAELDVAACGVEHD